MVLNRRQSSWVLLKMRVRPPRSARCAIQRRARRDKSERSTVLEGRWNLVQLSLPSSCIPIELNQVSLSTAKSSPRRHDRQQLDPGTGVSKFGMRDLPSRRLVLPTPQLDTMAPSSTEKSSSTPKLALVRGGPVPVFTVKLFVHFLYIFLPRLFITLPLGIFYHHVLMRWRSSVVQVVGRPWYADFVAQLSAYYLGRASVAEARLLFNRTQAYDMVHAGPHFSGYRDWVSYVKVNGTAGRWLAPPNTKRSEDEVVFFYIHG